MLGLFFSYNLEYLFLAKGTDRINNIRKPPDTMHLETTLVRGVLFLNMQDDRVARNLDPALEFQLHSYWLGCLGQDSLSSPIKLDNDDHNPLFLGLS